MKKKLISAILFLSIFIILELMLMPVVVNFMNLLYGLKDLYVPGIPIFNIKLLFSSEVAIRFSIAITVLIIVLMMFLKNRSGLGKGNKGNEHGSARLLKDDEFASLLKGTTFRKDEYNYPRDWETMEVEDQRKKYAIETCDMNETTKENTNTVSVQLIQEEQIENNVMIDEETGEVIECVYVDSDGGDY